ncbi:MAG: squalene synthase HpnC [Burkholderiales bacterium]|nr:MAG: squalene synthase HpnC [Betaproteobacteria bacterium]TAG79586.1 MAG: squalene synthase HpnC [Burkholderiales bacterium]
MAVDNHYENFPVASWLIPRGKRPAVAALYRFARGADDLADEGDASPADRQSHLDDVLFGLDCIFSQVPTNNKIASYAKYFKDKEDLGVSSAPFKALVSAFRQDVEKTRYQDRAELLDYADRSANPVGRVMLAIFGVKSATAHRASDAICTALQLINFWQDASVDIEKGRIYVPQSEFAKHCVDAIDFPSHPKHRELMRAQYEHAETMLWSGCSLLRELNGRFRIEIAFTIAGGARILEKIEANDYDVTKRPTLRWYDSARLTWLALKALRMSKTAAIPPKLI